MRPETSIAVVGSGAAGIAAAVTAARAGWTTLLIDRRAAAGGTGGFSGLTTLCGLYDEQGGLLNDGFTREFVEALSDRAPVKMGKVWVLPYRQERFREVSSCFLAQMPNLQALWSVPLAHVVIESERIVSINGFKIGAVIDCSGCAEVAKAISADCLETDETTQAPAIVFPLRNVSRSLNTLPEVSQVLLPLARAGLPPVSFQPSLEPHTATVKFTGRADQAGQIIEFLRRHVSGFENCEIGSAGFVLAKRAGRMVIGEYVLTGADVLAGQKFPDAVARCAWPIEQWSADGMARLRYLPAGAYYEIPARSLRAARVENLFMGGKTISADVDAIASARVMGCCLATGAAAAQLAAQFLQSARAHASLI